MNQAQKKEKFYFYKGNINVLDKLEDKTKENILAQIQKEILQIFDVKNLSFLLGSGCSSFVKESEQIGIPTMEPLAKLFYATLNAGDKDVLRDIVKIDISIAPFNNNLESFLEVLFSFNFIYDVQGDKALKQKIQSLIDKTKEFILEKCINKANIAHTDVIDLYKLFYKKLVYRNNSLSKVNIFTTNYDLYSEKALDQLSILYSNGFSGNIERYFNPTTFNYAFAEQMELSSNKWNVIDNFVYLYKLHGSVNWVETDTKGKIFNIQEIQDPTEKIEASMIYPTPMKQTSSFGSPYSDLFREFQKKLMQEKNILVTAGYSFSDQHVNNLIYQALTIPTFRIVIFQDPAKESIKRLLDLNDPRIWIIGGEIDSENIHYFSYIVNNLLPDIRQQKIESSIEQAIKSLIDKK